MYYSSESHDIAISRVYSFYMVEESVCRLFMALQETYGPGVGWQFWYLLVSMPSEGSAAEDGAGEQSSEQVMTAFEQVWGGLPVRSLESEV